MPGALIVRRALPADARDIWLWRNDACTRAMSVSPEEVAWEAHAEWFAASLNDRNRFLYVGCLGDASRKVGICRFDLGPGRALAEASINLNPAMRGLNLSHRLLAAGIRLFLAGRHVDLRATVKQRNTASIRCFTRCGFVLHGEDAEYRYYRLPAHPAGVKAARD
ncbi:MAG: GNAT family N-acetyltransferase [Rhodospirillales bacterium]|nr:GNAT family N-acetyltransferase [Rhodospirillales bacterium]